MRTCFCNTLIYCATIAKKKFKKIKYWNVICLHSLDTLKISKVHINKTSLKSSHKKRLCWILLPWSFLAYQKKRIEDPIEDLESLDPKQTLSLRTPRRSLSLRTLRKALSLRTLIGTLRRTLRKTLSLRTLMKI